MSERIFPDMWVDPEDDPRESDTEPVGEKQTLQDYLTRYRLTLELKCEGLTPEQLAARSVPPSSMSLLGLIRHMAAVEHSWFRRVARATGEPRMWGKDEHRDADFDGAVGTQECVDEAFAAWREKIADADAWFSALPEGELGRELAMPGDEGSISARSMVVHMIEEYARHCGHADLLRECIDGRTGQ